MERSMEMCLVTAQAVLRAVSKYGYMDAWSRLLKLHHVEKKCVQMHGELAVHLRLLQNHLRVRLLDTEQSTEDMRRAVQADQGTCALAYNHGIVCGSGCSRVSASVTRC